MSFFVLDASMTLEWFFPGPDSGPALEKRTLFEHHSAMVPPVWRLEITNFLVTQRRRDVLSEAEADVQLSRMLALPLGVLSDSPPEVLLKIAHGHHLTAYDACYLHAAMLAGWPLATLDKALIRAAEAVGVPVA